MTKSPGDLYNVDVAWDPHDLLITVSCELQQKLCIMTTQTDRSFYAASPPWLLFKHRCTLLVKVAE
jgi:hypothetical protein